MGDFLNWPARGRPFKNWTAVQASAAIRSRHLWETAEPVLQPWSQPEPVPESFPTGCLPLDSYSSVNQLLSYGTYSAKWVRRFVGVNDPEGRLPRLAGGLASARVISRLS